MTRRPYQFSGYKLCRRSTRLLIERAQFDSVMAHQVFRGSKLAMRLTVTRRCAGSSPAPGASMYPRREAGASSRLISCSRQISA